MTIEEWDKLSSTLQAIITSLSIVIAGIWAYRRFVIQQEKYPNLIFRADINVIGKQGDDWLVELIALIDNKGKAQHKMKNFKFGLNAIFQDAALTTSDEWGGQVDFNHKIAKGSFLPATRTFFFIDPGTTAKYSYITKVTKDAAFLILHCTFDYFDNRGYSHSAEKTIKVIEKAEAVQVTK